MSGLNQNVDIKVKFDNDEQYMEYKPLLDEIYEDFIGRPVNNVTKMLLQNAVSKLDKDIKKDNSNPSTRIGVEIKGSYAYNPVDWMLEDVLYYYERFVPENHKPSESYSRIEVNNMLFDLKSRGIINSYTPVAEPVFCSFNAETFPEDKVIKVGLHYNKTKGMLKKADAEGLGELRGRSWNFNY